jgi:hypothetical protein
LGLFNGRTIGALSTGHGFIGTALLVFAVMLPITKRKKADAEDRPDKMVDQSEALESPAANSR